jgi:hypothetical protein
MGDDARIGRQRGIRFLSPMLTIAVNPSNEPLSDLTAKKFIARHSRQGGRDFKVRYDRPTQLLDGTPAQEAVIDYSWGPDVGEMHAFLLSVKKDTTHIFLSVVAEAGFGGEEVKPEELKNIAYTLQLIPGKDTPVDVAPNVRAFLDKWCKDIGSGDLTAVMSSYSDKYKHKALNKFLMRQWLRDDPASLLKMGLSSADTTITVYVDQGNKAFLAGFVSGKTKDGERLPDLALNGEWIIKENGQWKWYGNQK